VVSSPSLPLLHLQERLSLLLSRHSLMQVRIRSLLLRKLVLRVVPTICHSKWRKPDQLLIPKTASLS
jgi:hypothetical protein